MKIPLFFNNTARSARAGRFRRWLKRYVDLHGICGNDFSANRFGKSD